MENPHNFATLLSTMENNMPVAAERTVQIIRAFVQMRKLLTAGLRAVGPNDMIMDKDEVRELYWELSAARQKIIRLQQRLHPDLERENYRQPVTDREIDTILSLKRRGDKVSVIADVVERPKSTVRSVLRRYL